MATPSAIDLSDIVSYVDQREQVLLSRLTDYLRRPSISAYGEGIDEVATYIADVMHQMGLATRVMPTSGWPMVFGQYTARSDTPTMLLMWALRLWALRCPATRSAGGVDHATV